MAPFFVCEPSNLAENINYNFIFLLHNINKVLKYVYVNKYSLTYVR